MSKATIGVTSWNERGRFRGFWKDGVGSTRNLNHLHSNCTGLSNRTILELWSVKRLQLPKEGLVCKLGLISISGLHKVAAASRQPQSQGRPLCISSWSSLHTAYGSQGKPKEPCPPILVINTFITNCYFWLQRYREEDGGHCCLTSLNCCELLPTPN